MWRKERGLICREKSTSRNEEGIVGSAG
jgi:hypothetical protein